MRGVTGYPGRVEPEDTRPIVVLNHNDLSMAKRVSGLVSCPISYRRAPKSAHNGNALVKAGTEMAWAQHVPRSALVTKFH